MRQKKKRTSGCGAIREAVRDLVVPTSLGLGLALAGCSGTPEVPRVDGATEKTDTATDQQIYAIMPPPADSGVDQQIYPIMPPPVDAGAKDGDQPDQQIYPIMPPLGDAGGEPDGHIFAIMPPRNSGTNV